MQGHKTTQKSRLTVLKTNHFRLHIDVVYTRSPSSSRSSTLFVCFGSYFPDARGFVGVAEKSKRQKNGKKLLFSPRVRV